MALQTMYQAKPNSPQTTLSGIISASDTTLTVFDGSILPPAPNMLTLGTDENAEVVYYTSISGNVVSGLVRGYSGTTASVWEEGTQVAREFTSYDHDTFIANINSVQGEVTTLQTTVSGKQSSYSQDASMWDTTPTAGSTKPVTSGGIKTALDTKTPLATGVLRFTNQATSATSSSAVFCTITNAAITTKHVVVSCEFSTPSAVTSNVTWSTDTAGKVTLTGINTDANNKVAITLAIAGNL